MTRLDHIETQIKDGKVVSLTISSPGGCYEPGLTPQILPIEKRIECFEVTMSNGVITAITPRKNNS